MKQQRPRGSLKGHRHHPHLTRTDRELARGIEQPKWGRTRLGRMVQIPVGV